MRYNLRTLLIVLALGPPVLAWFWLLLPVIAYATACAVLSGIIVAPICLAADYVVSLALRVPEKQ